MTTTTAAISQNDGCPTCCDDIMADMEGPCESFDPFNASEAAYDSVNQNQHQNNSINLLAGHDLTWGYSLPWQEGPQSCSSSSASDSSLSPSSVLSGLCPDWQTNPPYFAPLPPHSLDQTFLSSESDEFWQDAQWPLWPPQQGNQKRLDGAGFGQLIWPVVPDFNINQFHFDDLTYLSHTSHAAGFPQHSATSFGPDSFTGLPMPPVIDTRANWTTAMESIGCQPTTQTISQQPQDQLPVATVPHHVSAPEPASTISLSPCAAASEWLESRPADSAELWPDHPLSPRQPAFSSSSSLEPHHQQQETVSPIVGDLPAFLPDLRPSRPPPAARSHLVSPAYQVAPTYTSPSLRLSALAQPKPSPQSRNSDQASPTHVTATALSNTMCATQSLDESVSSSSGPGVALDDIPASGSKAVEVEKSPPRLQTPIFIDLTIDQEEASPRKRRREHENSFTADGWGCRPKRHKPFATVVEAERGTQKVKYNFDALTVRSNNSSIKFSWDSRIGKWKSEEGGSLPNDLELQSLESVSIRKGAHAYRIKLEKSSGCWRGEDIWERIITLSDSEVEKGLKEHRQQRQPCK